METSISLPPQDVSTNVAGISYLHNLCRLHNSTASSILKYILASVYRNSGHESQRLPVPAQSNLFAYEGMDQLIKWKEKGKEYNMHART